MCVSSTASGGDADVRPGQHPPVGAQDVAVALHLQVLVVDVAVVDGRCRFGRRRAGPDASAEETRQTRRAQVGNLAAVLLPARHQHRPHRPPALLLHAGLRSQVNWNNNNNNNNNNMTDYFILDWNLHRRKSCSSFYCPSTKLGGEPERMAANNNSNDNSSNSDNNNTTDASPLCE